MTEEIKNENIFELLNAVPRNMHDAPVRIKRPYAKQRL